MPTLVHRFVLAGTEGDVPLARRKVIDKVRTWGVPLDDETADVIRLVASELITNAVVHGEGSVTVALYHQPGRVVIDVLDDNPLARQRVVRRPTTRADAVWHWWAASLRGVPGSHQAAESVYGRRSHSPWRRPPSEPPFCAGCSCYGGGAGP